MLTPLARIAGLVLPACRRPGAQGVPVEPPDFASLPRRRNAALAAPASILPAPDTPTPLYPLAARDLLAALDRLARERFGAIPLAADPERLQAGWVARSALLNFPDVIWAEARPSGTSASHLLLYSHSVYGYSDFGVNRRRIAAWVAALGAALERPGRR